MQTRRRIVLEELAEAVQPLLGLVGRGVLVRSVADRDGDINDAVIVVVFQRRPTALEPIPSAVGLLEAKARADVTPNVDVTLNPFYSAPTKEIHGLVVLTAAVPIFNRNQGNIQAARADLARAHAEERQAELKLVDRLAAAHQRYQAGKLQAEAFQKRILPDARESLKLVQAGYRQGDAKYDYTAVLQAQQVLFQAQLAHTMSLGDLWRSVAEIAGILELQDASAGCATAR